MVRQRNFAFSYVQKYNCLCETLCSLGKLGGKRWKSNIFQGNTTALKWFFSSNLIFISPSPYPFSCSVIECYRNISPKKITLYTHQENFWKIFTQLFSVEQFWFSFCVPQKMDLKWINNNYCHFWVHYFFSCHQRYYMH